MKNLNNINYFKIESVLLGLGLEDQVNDMLCEMG